MKIKLKDAMEIVDKIVKERDRIASAFRSIDEDITFLRKRIYNLEEEVRTLKNEEVNNFVPGNIKKEN